MSVAVHEGLSDISSNDLCLVIVSDELNQIAELPVSDLEWVPAELNVVNLLGLVAIDVGSLSDGHIDLLLLHINLFDLDNGVVTNVDVLELDVLKLDIGGLGWSGADIFELIELFCGVNSGSDQCGEVKGSH